MCLGMAMPRACAWCSHGHVHGIDTRAPVDYLPRGYTIGKHASREAVESIFMSSLKESDQLKTSGKVMKQMQAREHSQLWLGLCSDKYDQFWAVNRRLMEGSDAWRHLPVRSDYPPSTVV